MIQIPSKPPSNIQPPINVKPQKSEGTKSEPRPVVNRGAQKNVLQLSNRMDSGAIAAKLAFYASQEKDRELKFMEIIEREILRTGMRDPQKALEAANERLSGEIDSMIKKIKKNKDLMEEAKSWQDLAELLEQELSEEQVEGFLKMIESGVKELEK